LLAGHADSDDENQRRGSDHHAKPGQQESDFVSTKGIEGEAHNLAECELRGQLRYCSGDRHVKLDATRCGGESQSGRGHSAVDSHANS
jgi:hypothetical protein